MIVNFTAFTGPTNPMRWYHAVFCFRDLAAHSGGSSWQGYVALLQLRWHASGLGLRRLLFAHMGCLHRWAGARLGELVTE